MDRKPEQPGDNDPNKKLFSNLLGYGDVVVVRDKKTSGDRQYFMVKPVKSDLRLRWSARCGNNRDQVYDHNDRYVGYDSRLTVMFPFVCRGSSLTGGSIQPR